MMLFESVYEGFGGFKKSILKYWKASYVVSSSGKDLAPVLPDNLIIDVLSMLR
jgi:hypothetical protein